MKILTLCYEYPPVGGGGGRVAAAIAENLSRKGHEVRVITAGLRHLSGHENKNGVRILRPQSFRKREDTCSVLEMGLYLLTSFLPSWRVCQNWQPDVIHAHFVVPTGILAFLLNLFTRTPYVLTAHLGDVPGGVPEQTADLFRFVGPFIKPICRRAAAVTAVSKFVADLAQQAWSIQPEVILNGIPDSLESSQKSVHSQPRLLILGRLSIQKDPLLALHALALVKDFHWSLDIIGDGPLAQAARDLAKDLGIADRIVFSGWLGSEEVSRHLADSDLLLMTSIHEGLPMAGIEALQHGLAIIGSQIGGLADLVENGKNGFLCKRTPLAFAEALHCVLSQPDRLRVFQNASREKAKNFCLADRVKDYERVLTQAINSV